MVGWGVWSGGCWGYPRGQWGFREAWERPVGGVSFSWQTGETLVIIVLMMGMMMGGHHYRGGWWRTACVDLRARLGGCWE
jgi:hypothetical protein